MFIKEVCRECNLTRKAVEYYERQGLIQPAIAENGYRVYSQSDISRLKEIALLRKLDISVANIREIIDSQDKESALSHCKKQMEISLQRMEFQIDQIDQLIKSNYDLLSAQKNIEGEFSKNSSIIEKLIQAFPGSFGTLLSFHFGHFLNEEINSKVKEKAFQNIIIFLDQVNFPVELEEKLEKIYENLDAADLKLITGKMVENVTQFENIFPQLQENIDKYLVYRDSDEYKNSPAQNIREALTFFLQESGYYEIFIPNLKLLSESYREYSKKLEDANKLFLEKYPQIK